MAQLMALPLTVSCFSKIQIGFTFLVPAHLGSPGKGPLTCVCVCVPILMFCSGNMSDSNKQRSVCHTVMTSASLIRHGTASRRVQKRLISSTFSFPGETGPSFLTQRKYTKQHYSCYNTYQFNDTFSRTTQESRYQKGKTNLDFSDKRDSEWQWHQLGHIKVCTSLQTDNHASTPPLSFLQVGRPFQQRQSTEGIARYKYFQTAAITV